MSQQCQWCICIVRLNIHQRTCRHCHAYVDVSVTKQQYSQPIGHFTQVQWLVVGPLQLNCLSRLNLFIPCVCASSTCLHQNFSWQTTSSSVLAVLTVTHVSTSIYRNIYMEHFRELGLGNMCATNAGGMIHNYRSDTIISCTWAVIMINLELA